MRRFLPLVLILVLALAALASGLVRQYQVFVQTPLDLQQAVVLEVSKGASMRRVLTDLERSGLTRANWRWRLFNRLYPVTIQAGEYALEPGMLPSDLLTLLASGRVIRYPFTIVEGWTFARLRQALAQDEVLVQELALLGDDAELMAGLGAPDTHPEGWFLPETYHFVRGDSDLDVLRRAHLAMRAALEEAWSSRDDIPLATAYELLILASIVEKETAVRSERTQVAGVFTRRLRQGWRLETDPTVIYGLGDAYDGDIRTRDLRTDTPYNTYTRHGLPPTPIALPGRASLLASARPAPGSAMFFVADGQGGHTFSDTLAEHEQAVRKMLGRQP
jgi:UPF0755 protein